jgi:predicted peptidase
MKRMELALLIAGWLGACAGLCPAAKTTVTLGTWTERQPFRGANGQTIHYYLFTPKAAAAGRKLPLVLWLHGGLKSNGRGGPNMPMAAFYRDEHQKRRPCFVLRPVAIKGRNWVSPRGAGTGSHALPAKPAASIPVLLELLERTVRRHAIDPGGLHVVGASMGGYGVWDLIARRPKMFASAMPICGGGDPGKAAAIKHVKIWIFHSANDRIVPVRGSREMFAALMKARGEKPVVKEDAKAVAAASPDGRIRYTELKTGGHNAWDRALGSLDVIQWALGARRGESKAASQPPREAGAVR